MMGHTSTDVLPPVLTEPTVRTFHNLALADNVAAVALLVQQASERVIYGGESGPSYA